MQPIAMPSHPIQPLQTGYSLRGQVKMSEAKMNEVAQDFESQFIGQMLENMFSTVDTNGFMGGGEAEETYRSLMIEQYGKLMSQAGGIGVADYVKREMLRMQEV
jgi:flagellar protein FlgJ